MSPSDQLGCTVIGFLLHGRSRGKTDLLIHVPWYWFFFAADFSVAALAKLPISVFPEQRLRLVTMMNETSFDGHSSLCNDPHPDE